MKGNEEVLNLLNQLLTNELTAINQYYVHAKMCQNWGYERLYQKVRAESIDEMKHADQVIERILFLDGVPNLQRYHKKLKIGETVKEEQLEVDLQLEYLGDRVPQPAAIETDLPQGRRQRDRGHDDEDPRVRRGAHRLARSAARADPAARRAEPTSRSRSSRDEDQMGRQGAKPPRLAKEENDRRSRNHPSGLGESWRLGAASSIFRLQSHGVPSAP